MIIKCKMCGGTLHPQPNATTCECEFCGTVQTLPKLDSDRRANLYDRANHFRRSNDYDKAMGIFEQILQEDRTDAEVYWSLVLCRYGIEYVEDPATHKRVPTVNRVQYTSILADEDYKSALEYADAVQRELYEQEAHAIDEIQKGILAISRQEKPFDVFICYKETDADGKRTPDSVLATDLYHQLTREGFKVFFSRITLEDKLGQQYEPYIFAALNSAKVMVVLGTKPEYFNAVWVKNEWSRYLALIRAGADKALVPAYRDMDPYDLPEEFSHLQAQDMSKLGFMQDLIHGIKKLAAGNQAEKKVEAADHASAGKETAVPGVRGLMKRASLFLEDGDFESASEYLNRVLDLDPEHAPAYAAKVCVDLGLRSESELGNVDFLYEDNADWQKALRFADEEHRQTYEGYLRQAQARVQALLESYAIECAMEMAVNKEASSGKLKQEMEQYRSSHMSSAADHSGASHRDGYAQREATFQKAVAANEPTTSEQAYRQAADMLAALPDSEKAEQYATQCLALAEQARKKALYQSAIPRYSNRAAELDRCASILASIPDYMDSLAKAGQYREQAETIRAGLYAQAEQKMRAAGTESMRWENVQALLKQEDLSGYRDVKELRQKAQAAYERSRETEKQAYRQKQDLLARQQAAKEARTKRLFAVLIAAAVLVTACAILVTKAVIPGQKYRAAEKLMADGQYHAASEAFAALGDYRDAAERQWQPYAQQADALLEAGEYDSAADAYLALYRRSGKTYENALSMADECYYRKAAALEAEGKADEALAIYETIPDYQDSTAKQQAIYMERGVEALKAGQLSAAREAFAACGDMQEAQEQLKLLDVYESADAQQKQGDYIAARTAYLSLGEYLDAPAQAEACGATQYATAQGCLKSGQMASAYAMFTGLGDYSDSASQAAAIADAYTAAEGLLSAGNYDGAAQAFSALHDYQDSAEKALEAYYQKAGTLADSGDYDEAVALYDSLGNYRDSEAKAQTVRYTKAEALLAAGDKTGAEAVYASIPEYGDVPQKLIALRTELGSDALERKDYAAALAYYLDVPQSEEVRTLEYRLAQTCYDEGCYEYATKAYELLGQYELSVSKLPVARYAYAAQLFDEGKYAEAAEQFTLLQGSTDSAERAKESLYQLGLEQLEKKAYAEAKQTFGRVSGYRDANDQARECDYRAAADEMAAGNYAEAAEGFEALGSYSDSAVQAKECGYQLAEADLASGRFSDAQKQYEALNGYSDSEDKARLCIYEQAKAYAAGGDYAAAETLYASISGYGDSAEMVRLCRYEQGNARFAAQDYAGALTFYTDLDYNDSETLAAQCHCAMGRQYLSIGNVEESVREYVQALTLSEARRALYDIGKDYATVNQMEKAIETLWVCGDYEPSMSLLSEIAGLLEQSGNAVNAAIARYAIRSNNASADIVMPDVTVDIAQGISAYGILPDQQFANAIWYTMGEVKREAADWTGAVTAFATAGDYSDAETQVYATYYAEGEAKRNAGDWVGAVTAFTNAEEYNDANAQITETHYQHAQSLMKSGDYNQAYALLMTLKGYADVDGLLANDENLLAAAREAMFSVGNYVTFGTYPQTAAGNDKTPIEWLILARNGDNALLLSRYGLDAKPYNTGDNITWEKCTLRAWLNDDFKNQAFTPAEQSAILLTNVDNSSIQCYSGWSTSGGNNTQDKVFLLSYAEANKYLGVIYDNSSNTKSRVAPTAYAISHGAWTKRMDGEVAGWWWLRSPGIYQELAACIDYYGSLEDNYIFINGSVRPALWVNLESGIF